MADFWPIFWTELTVVIIQSNTLVSSVVSGQKGGSIHVNLRMQILVEICWLWSLRVRNRRGVGGRIVRFLQEVIQHFQIAIDRIGVGAEITLQFPQLVGGRLGFAAKVIHVHLSAHEGVDHGVVFACRLRITRQQLLADLLGDIRAAARQAKCSRQIRVGFHQGSKCGKIGRDGNLSGCGG